MRVCFFILCAARMFVEVNIRAGDFGLLASLHGLAYRILGTLFARGLLERFRTNTCLVPQALPFEKNFNVQFWKRKGGGGAVSETEPVVKKNGKIGGLGRFLYRQSIQNVKNN